ncbi:hypothetical protein BDV38DRAFT_98160 [Aspergillus pseudotamarii]|uniref:Uncharacterized protein n=1 Tax=Aspergillus pseudotamarii TaxID=132259 RepID=A0A5N6ST10_ASPPS|nr:uncharacterized protein BDV38DRAFT_98160 [Aspergillus pseudotamarii]KAE8136959.1 hypothetical protein BDV38DRAFT_98160 [Aspergillus pseudotamarii]
MYPCPRICNKARSSFLVIIFPATSAESRKGQSLPSMTSENQLNSPAASSQQIQGNHRHAPRRSSNRIFRSHLI